MAYYKLMVFRLGVKKCEEQCDNCPSIFHSPKWGREPKCRLYSCHECGEILERGEPVVRVDFQATQVMDKRRAWLYNRGIQREPKEARAFVTFHKECYKRQLSNWIDRQLEGGGSQ